MSRLVLVRHAQASFFASDYDQLTPLGERQARELGEYWLRHGRVFDEVYAGPRRRQQHTAELVGEVYAKGGATWPETVILDDLDEYDLDGVLSVLAPLLAERDEAFRLLHESCQGTTGSDRLRAFQLMFEPLLRHWQSTPTTPPAIETWLAFRDRIAGVLRTILQGPGKSRRVAVFTSGGVIGTMLQQALGAEEGQALELNWRLRNVAVSEFLFSGERLSLDSFNSLAHLEDESLWTFR